MHKNNVHEILKSWGSKRQIAPPNNLALKNEILSKAPLFFDTPAEKRHLPWLSISFAVLSLLVLLGNSASSPISPTMGRMSLPTSPPSFMESNGSAKDSYLESGGVSQDSPYYYPDVRNQGGVPITDTRQFLKTYYNATIKTRDVEEKTSRIETAVRGAGGRIDGSNSGEEYGYISFAIPASQLGIFREEIRSLTGKKLIMEQLSSENLLPEKQSLEESKKRTESSLSAWKNERTELVRNHTTVNNSYNAQIASLNQETALLQNEWQTADQGRRVQISARLSQIQSEKNTILARLGEEEKSYRNRLAALNNNIAGAEKGLGYIAQEDQNLLERVDTVTGNISLQKVNVWEIADIYTPGPLLFWILALAVLISYLRYRFPVYAII